MARWPLTDARRRAGGGEERAETDDAVDGRVEGQYSDVQGAVPFTQPEHGEGRLRDDTRDGRLWTSTYRVPASLGHGSLAATRRGRPWRAASSTRR